MAAIGVYVGLRIDRATVLYVLKRLRPMICCTLLLIAASTTRLRGCVVTPKGLLPVYLATSPGGLDSWRL
ncbi:AbrB family transcriptional regulator [Pseudomonas syringae]|uniref:AbrB family transcriptional regulator n=1 Tax=Pseudomonas syringae TaxID=317 RepID=UPI0009B46F30